MMHDCFTEDDVREIIGGFFMRCALARACGGIALQDIADGAPRPDGWVLDMCTCYYLPPTVDLSEMLNKGDKLIN